MPISLVASVAIYKNQLAIGYNNELLFNFSKDMTFFRKVTSEKISTTMNIVIMGHNTYDSIPNKYRPLPNRINFVLTTNKSLISLNSTIMNDKVPYYLDFEAFTKFYINNLDLNVFVVGGSQIYNMFLSDSCNKLLIPKRLFITHVIRPKFINEPDKFMVNFINYKLISYSETVTENNAEFRILTYILTNTRSQEYKYLDLMKSILDTGNKRIDRTHTGTLSIFAARMEFNIFLTFPIMTTRQIPFKAIVEELLWFCRGETDSKILEQRGVNIWKGNTSREFLDKQGLQHYPEGILGAGYGYQWRNFGAQYPNKDGFDQLEYIVNLLKTDPFSRRIMLSSWNPPDFNKTALVPCHTSVQFYVETINKVNFLSCQFTMRSSDSLAWSYNVCSYTILTYILALKCDMKPYKIIYISGDTHIYNNHIKQVKEQLTRKCRPEPKLHLDVNIKNKEWQDIKFTDFELIGYFPDKKISLTMSV